MDEKLNLKVFRGLNEKSSLMLKKDEVWISTMPIDNSYQFEKEINSSGQLKTAKAIKHKRIEKLKMNPSDNRIKIFYKTVLDKDKSQSFVFEDSAEMEFVLNHLVGITKFESSEEKESILTPIIKYGIPLILVIGVIALINLYLPEGQIEVKGRRTLMKVIYNAIGKTGFNILGAIASSILLILLGKRLYNPTNEIVYK